MISIRKELILAPNFSINKTSSKEVTIWENLKGIRKSLQYFGGHGHVNYHPIDIFDAKLQI